jgi:hypothetical protein
MGQWSRIWLYCISDGVPKRSLVVALIVGTILNPHSPDGTAFCGVTVLIMV